jgi:hypothetical protein
MHNGSFHTLTSVLDFYNSGNVRFLNDFYTLHECNIIVIDLRKLRKINLVSDICPK